MINKEIKKVFDYIRGMSQDTDINISNCFCKVEKVIMSDLEYKTLHYQISKLDNEIKRKYGRINNKELFSNLEVALDEENSCINKTFNYKFENLKNKNFNKLMELFPTLSLTKLIKTAFVLSIMAIGLFNPINSFALGTTTAQAIIGGNQIHSLLKTFFVVTLIVFCCLDVLKVSAGNSINKKKDIL